MEDTKQYEVVPQTEKVHPDRFGKPWKLRSKAWSTAAVCFGFFSLSVSRGVVGPTLPDLEVLMDASTPELSFILTGRQFGFILGNAVGGALFKHCNTWLILLCAATLFTPFLMLIGWMRNVIVFGCLISIGTFFGGFMVVGNMAIVKIWGDKNGPYMQALHCIYFAGFLFATLAAKPFLSNTELGPNTPDTETEVQLRLSNSSGGNPEPKYNLENSTGAVVTPLESHVEVPYMIAGGLMLLTGVFCICMLTRERFMKLAPIHRLADNSRLDGNDKALHKAQKVTFVSLAFCLLFSYTATEMNYSVFLPTFLVQSYGYTPQRAAITLSVYFTIFVCGRAFGIFAIRKVKPQTLLAAGITLTVMSNVMLYFSHLHITLIWFTISLAAIGMSTQYATIVSWTTEYIHLSGWAGTAILVSGATGYLLGPFFFGALFNVFGISSFMYILSSAVVLQVVLFIILLFYVRTLPS